MNTNVTDKLKLKYSENKDIVSSVSKYIENGRKLYVVFHILTSVRPGLSINAVSIMEGFL